MQDDRKECFDFGRGGERTWMAYSLCQGRTMIEVGALREQLGSGAPMIYLPSGLIGKDKLISLDFLTVNAGTMLQGAFSPWKDKAFVWTSQNMWNYPFLWNEVKTKKGCSWSKKLQCWQTGIDGYQLQHYRSVQDVTNIPAILFFLQVDDITAQKELPLLAGPCPKGIYACPVSWEPDTAYSKRWGLGCPVEKADMVYWNIDRLIYIASLEDVPGVRQVTTQPDEKEGIERARTREYYNPKPRIAIFNAQYNYQRHVPKCPTCRLLQMAMDDDWKYGDTFYVRNPLCEEGKRLIGILSQSAKVIYEDAI